MFKCEATPGNDTDLNIHASYELTYIDFCTENVTTAMGFHIIHVPWMNKDVQFLSKVCDIALCSGDSGTCKKVNLTA